MIAIGSAWQHKTRKSRVVVLDVDAESVEFQVRPIPHNPARGISKCAIENWPRFYEEVST